jgi:hypothetical protein
MLPSRFDNFKERFQRGARAMFAFSSPGLQILAFWIGVGVTFLVELLVPFSSLDIGSNASKILPSNTLNTT